MGLGFKPDADFEVPVEIPRRDILALRLSDIGSLSEAECGVHSMRSRSSANLNSVSELRRRVAECIHASSVFHCMPMRLINVNRLFYRVAKRLDTSVSEIVEDLIGMGYVTRIERQGHNVLYSSSILKEQLQSVDPDTLYERILSNMG